MGGSGEEKHDHPTQKPVDLMRRPLLNHLKRSEAVYDPFLGSGTTLAAAELTERVCYGIELDPKYVDVIVQRWQTLSGKKLRSTAMASPSRRSLRKGRWRNESNVAAWRSRPSRRRSGPGIRTCRACA
jgi:DNA modification methylase